MIEQSERFLNIESRLEELVKGGFNKIRGKVVFNKFIENLSDFDKKYLNNFHVTNVSMVEKDDEYFVGLRANHFVVEEGWNEKNNNIWYLVSCNHKGNRAMTLIEMII